jgi:Predicted permease, DMT superfamily
MKDLINRMPVADLLTERYTLAVLALLLIWPRCLLGLRRDTWVTGLLAGLLFGVGQIAQAIALRALPSAVSGFAVGLYVVITPLLAIFALRARIQARSWLSAALAVAALAVFTLLGRAGGGEISMPALAVTLGAAVLYAIHTLVLGHSYAWRRDAYAVAVIQLGTIAVVTALVAAPGGLTLPAAPRDWGLLAHLGLVACALGFLARSFGQRHVPPAPAAVILAAQPLWVTAFAVLLYGDPLTWPVIAGGMLTAAAVLLAVLRLET